MNGPALPRRLGSDPNLAAVGEWPGAASGLRANEVHLWHASVDPTDPLLATMEALLSENERLRYTSFHFAADRAAYLTARALTRLALSRCTAVDPREFRFVTNRYGRPAIAIPARFRHLRFNISHTHGLVACAIGLGLAVGVDVERNDRPALGDDFVRAFLSTHEYATLADMQATNRHQRIIQYWTLKEAYAKALGVGLSLPFKSIELDLGGSIIRLRHDGLGAGGHRTWNFRFAPVAPGFTVAVVVGAASGTDTKMILRRVAELGPPTINTGGR